MHMKRTLNYVIFSLDTFISLNSSSFMNLPHFRNLHTRIQKLESRSLNIPIMHSNPRLPVAELM